MKTLTLLRHAKSSWNNSALADQQRPLNDRGERDAPEMARRIQAAGIRPSLIVSSPAVRAWSTAKVVAQEISYPLEFLQRDSNIYLANLSTLIKVIGEQENGFNNILLVGHNPGLTEFANFLSPGLTTNLPTCGVVSVTFESDSWDLLNHENVSLELYDYPKRVNTPQH